MDFDQLTSLKNDNVEPGLLIQRTKKRDSVVQAYILDPLLVILRNECMAAG
jgi:hypothetical protein